MTPMPPDISMWRLYPAKAAGRRCLCHGRYLPRGVVRPWQLLVAAGLVIPCMVLRSAPAGEDQTLDWLLKRASTRPATSPTQPTTQPLAPFIQADDTEYRQGRITLSDGRKIEGQIRTTRGKPLRIYDQAGKEYRDVPLVLVRSMRATLLWERQEPEWHFRESGSDIKEFTGRTYPARELLYEVRLINGQEIRGGIVAPLYVDQDGQRRMYLLNKRQKGATGQSLKDLLYVEAVELD